MRDLCVKGLFIIKTCRMWDVGSTGLRIYNEWFPQPVNDFLECIKIGGIENIQEVLPVLGGQVDLL